MLREMPCGKERVFHYRNRVRAAQWLTQRLKDRTWFEFAEVDIEIPKSVAKVRGYVLVLLQQGGACRSRATAYVGLFRAHWQNAWRRKKLVGALSAEKLLVNTPLLRWYVEHGAVVKAVYRTIKYQATKILTWFVEQVMEDRRTGDVRRARRC